MIFEMELAAECPSCGSSSTQRKFPKSFTYLRVLQSDIHKKEYKPARQQAGSLRSDFSSMQAGSVLMNNVFIERSGTGIKAEDTKIAGRNVKIKDCGIGIDSENSDISINGLDIS